MEKISIEIYKALEKVYLPLPKSVTPSRIKENTEIFDFKLEVEDINFMDNLVEYSGKGTDSDNINF